MKAPALLVVFITCLFTTIQAEAPIPATASAYETVDERTLYVHGGITELEETSTTVTNQLFALDFTTNWTSSNPAWRSVDVRSAMGAPKAWGHSMVYDKASNSLVLWSTVGQGGDAVGMTTYSISDSSWTPTSDVLSKELSRWFKLRSATDPSTGFIYVPSGKNNGSEMAVYRADGRTGPKVMMPSAKIMAAAVTLSAVAWSTQRSSLLIYGGQSHSDPTALNPYLVEYSPQTSKWKRLATNGASPGSLVSHCMVPAYNGTKMIVFGGALYPDVVTMTNGAIEPATITRSIYVLDVKSLTWTKGLDPDPQYARSDMACGVSGDNFVAWGGEVHAKYITTLGTPIIYNLKTNTWTKEFVQTRYLKSDATPSITTTNTVTPTGSSALGSEDAVNTRRIALGVGAVVVTILVAALVFTCHRSRHRLAFYSRVSITSRGRSPQESNSTSGAQEDTQCVSPLQQHPQWPPFATGYQLRAPAGLPHHSTSAANEYSSPYHHIYSQPAETVHKGSTLAWIVNPFQTPAPEVHTSGLYRGLEEPGFRQDSVKIDGQTSPGPERSSIQLLGQPYAYESNTSISKDLDQGIKQQIALLEARRVREYHAQLISLQRLRKEHEEQLQALQRQLHTRPSSMAFQ
ncbi:unnamed protein product [Mortierella alpina]